MSERKWVKTNFLKIWSDNPRHGLQTENSKDLTEAQIINILIEVVGENKMFNLAKSICEEGGLIGSTNPVVVLNNIYYCVYDGNRRISCIKFLKDPNIIESDSLRDKIKDLLNKFDVSFLDDVFVYETSEEDALRIMDTMHTGDQDGIGIIAWDSYQRDVSLVKRNKKPMYSNAYTIASMLGYRKKSDFVIPYTDLDRLFSSQYLKNTLNFKVEKSNKDKIEDIILFLLKYKSELNFKSFSREFNQTSVASSEDVPMQRFCNWYLDQKKGKSQYAVYAHSITLFEDEEYKDELLNIKVFDSEGVEIKVEPTDIKIYYIDPIGKIRKSFQKEILGNWHTRINYKGAEYDKAIIRLQSLQEVKVAFNEEKKKVDLGSTLNLKDVVNFAFDSHGKDMRSSLVIKPIGNDAKIDQDILTADNIEGKYKFSFGFTNLGKPYSETVIIEIKERLLPLRILENERFNLFSFSAPCTINISPSVNKLIDEITTLSDKFESYQYVIACSIRAILELSFDELIYNDIIENNIGGKSEDKLEEKLNELKKCIEKNLSRLCQTFKKELPSYTTEKNAFQVNFDAKKLSGLLNLGAHKSMTRINQNEFKEIIQKVISPVLVYISLLLIKE